MQTIDAQLLQTIEQGNITRERYNYIRRIDALMTDEQVTLFDALNRMIESKRVSIIENDTIFNEQGIALWHSQIV